MEIYPDSPNKSVRGRTVDGPFLRWTRRAHFMGLGSSRGPSGVLHSEAPCAWLKAKCLKFLIIFERAVPQFHFALDP